MDEYGEYDKYVAYWLRLVESDLLTLDALMEKGRYLHALVFCQQVCEKILKALYAKKVETIPPYTHGLLDLVKKIGLELDEEQALMLKDLVYYYTKARYPDEISTIHGIDKETAQRFYDFTLGFLKWVKSYLT